MNDNSSFVAGIDKDGLIWQRGGYNQKDVPIGYTNQYFNNYVEPIKKDNDELFSKGSTYLEELYVIFEKTNGQFGRPRPKSPDEKQAEQDAINMQLLNMLKDLQAEIKHLKTTEPTKNNKAVVL